MTIRSKQAKSLQTKLTWRTKELQGALKMGKMISLIINKAFHFSVTWALLFLGPHHTVVSRLYYNSFSLRKKDETGLHSNPKVVYCFGHFSFNLAMQTERGKERRRGNRAPHPLYSVCYVWRSFVTNRNLRKCNNYYHFNNNYFHNNFLYRSKDIWQSIAGPLFLMWYSSTFRLVSRTDVRSALSDVPPWKAIGDCQSFTYSN